MNHRGTEIADPRPAGVLIALCVLCLSGSTALGTTDNWPRRYNEGVTAYHSNDFSRAAAMFENATASRDRALQQRALYNLGNTEYRIGQAQPAQAQQLWEHALQNYETAMALDPKDADAKFNHDFVKKKLDELKKQQQQEQSQKNQQDQQKQREQEKPQDQQQQGSKGQGSQQPKQQPQQSMEQQQQAQEQKGKQPEQQAQQQKSPSPEKKPQGENGQPENYDKLQATALLNDLRENERNWNFFPEVQMKDLKNSGEPAKDW
ncbi:MAG TPA: hypothetical protein VL486_16125 [Verrucomicrobiae bacterium]|nr:hypothetical protein [Verrucomicrobiae bacterium]